MTTTMPTTQSYWLSGLPWASPGGRHLYPNLWLSTVSRLFNPLSPDLFPPSDDYDVSATHAAPLVSFRGRQWSIPVAASGQFLMSLDTGADGAAGHPSPLHPGNGCPGQKFRESNQGAHPGRSAHGGHPEEVVPVEPAGGTRGRSTDGPRSR